MEQPADLNCLAWKYTRSSFRAKEKNASLSPKPKESAHYLSPRSTQETNCAYHRPSAGCRAELQAQKQILPSVGEPQAIRIPSFSSLFIQPWRFLCVEGRKAVSHLAGVVVAHARHTNVCVFMYINISYISIYYMYISAHTHDMYIYTRHIYHMCI